jgi:ketosteroid isomerase-like protein
LEETTMAEGMAERFITALGRLEADRDADALVALYTDDAETGNVNAPEGFSGPDGARRFWTEYRGTFGEMKSEFRNRISDGDRIALEWTTTGTSVAGKPVEYSGVSIIEVRGDKVARFKAYFNPSALGQQITE